MRHPSGTGARSGAGGRTGVAGGGAQGALTWGVLDRLLEEGLGVHAFCSVSSDALIGVTLAQGSARDGHGEARAARPALWQRFPRVHAMSPLQSAPLGCRPWGWEPCKPVVWRGLEPASHLAQKSDRDPVIPLTPHPAVRGYHCPSSHTPAAHPVAGRNSVQPCV